MSSFEGIRSWAAGLLDRFVALEVVVASGHVSGPLANHLPIRAPFLKSIH